MIRKRLCWLLGHSVLVDFSQCVQPEPRVIVGDLIRRCVHCERVLPGADAQPGDRARRGDEPPLMSALESELYLEFGVPPNHQRVG